MASNFRTGAVKAFLAALEAGDLTALEIAAATGFDHHDIRNAAARVVKPVKITGARRAHILTWKVGPPMGARGQRYMVAVYRLGHGENAEQPEGRDFGAESEDDYEPRRKTVVDPRALSPNSSPFRFAESLKSSHD